MVTKQQIERVRAFLLTENAFCGELIKFIIDPALERAALTNPPPRRPLWLTHQVHYHVIYRMDTGAMDKGNNKLERVKYLKSMSEKGVFNEKWGIKECKDYIEYWDSQK